MKEKEMLEMLEKVRKRNKDEVNRGKEEVKKVLENASNCLIVATDRDCGIVGNNLDVMATLTCLLSTVLEETMITKKMLHEAVDTADNFNFKKDDDISQIKDLLSDLKDMMKKVEKL